MLSGCVCVGPKVTDVGTAGVTARAESDDLCQCACKVYQVADGKPYSTICTCNETSICPPLECQSNDHRADMEKLSVQSKEPSKQLSGKDPTRKNRSATGDTLMSKRSLSISFHLPEGSHKVAECSCECALSAMLDKASCNCTSEDNIICGIGWQCHSMFQHPHTGSTDRNREDLEHIAAGMVCAHS